MGKHRKCYIQGCNSVSGSDNNISFHRLNVSDPAIYQQWIKTISESNNQPNITNHRKTSSICSNHFTDACFQHARGASFVRKLKNDAVPSIFPFMQTNEEYITDDLYPSPFLDSPDIVGPSITTAIDLKPINIPVPVPPTVAATPTTPYRRSIVSVRYPGDIGNDFEDTSRDTLIKYIQLLKCNNQNKTKKIKRLEANNRRQKQKIQRLKELLENLQQ